jgi:hypothetical protein
MKKVVIIVAVCVGAVLLLCGGGAVLLAAVGGTNNAVQPATGQQEPQDHTPGGITNPDAPAAEEFGDGTWAVGAEIKAGTYTSTVPTGDFAFCFWERLSGFSGNPNEAIEYGSGNEGARMRVTIAAKDVGFKSDGCGTWKRTGK